MKNGKANTVLLSIVIFCSFLVIFNLGTANASTNISGVISQDTTWTPSGSPYVLTAKTLVAEGVTLTIQPGVTVNLGDYYIKINGTLAAKGTSSNQIQFNGGSLNFMESNANWNEQTGTGCIIENAVIEGTKISTIGAIKVNQCTIHAPIDVQSSSVILNSNIIGDINKHETIGNPKVLGNIITGEVHADIITNNKITGDVYALTTVQDNVIIGKVMVESNCAISNNYIQGTICGSKGTSTISSNTITGGEAGISFLPSMESDQLCTTISHNKITAKTTGISINSHMYYPFTGGGHYNATINENIISGCAYSGIVIDDESGDDYAVVNGNIFSDNYIGVVAFPSSIIQGNLIINNHYGALGGHLTENTIVNNVCGVMGTFCSNNNFGNNSQYNFALGTYLTFEATANANATNNWWGTTDTHIGQSIYDYNDDFDLGVVTFEPFLTAPNPNAPSLTYLPTAGSSNTPSTNPTSSPTPVAPEYPQTILLLTALSVSVVLTLMWRKQRHERF